MGSFTLNHEFEPSERNSRFCGVMLSHGTRGNPEVGYVSMSVECGYPESEHPTRMDNHPACGAPKNARWGYLPCGCCNDGFGGHL